MTMDHEVVEEGCRNCSALRNEMEKRNIQMENNNAQQLAGFLTLKQKIIGTDKLIREYQASKVERDILTRKNEEFVHLIDQLHRDLSIRNQEYTQLCANAELLKKANSEYEVKVKQLCDEAQKWKFQAEAGQNFTSQLVEKVKILEKYETEAKHSATVSRDHEKIENKLQVLKGQLKDARETATKSKKEFTKIQKDYTQLMKYAKEWGRLAESQGKLSALQKRFFIKLCNKEYQETGEVVDPDIMEANEIDEQSKLLEHLLDDGNGSESVTTPIDTLRNDMAMSEEHLSSRLIERSKSPGKSLFIKQTEQTPVRAQRRRGHDSGTSSKKSSPNKTSPETRTTRARTRTVSQNSVSQSSDADNALESEKENSKSSGPRTRSRSVKITQLPGPKSPEDFVTPNPKAITQSNLPESVDDIPCRSLVSMETVLMTEPTVGQGPFRKKNLHGSLSSSESDSELPDALKLFEDNRTITKTSTTPTTESIAGVKPLISLFEPDISDDRSKEKNGKLAGDQYVAKEQSEFQTSANPSSLFDFDSSSDSDLDMIPVPTCKLSTVNKSDDRNTLLNTIPSSTTASLDIGEKTISDPVEKSVMRELPCSPTSGTGTWNESNASRNIFELENNIDINAPTQNSNATQSLQQKMSEQLEETVNSDSIFALDTDLNASSSNPDSDVKKSNEEIQSKSLNVEVAVQAPVLLDEDLSTATLGNVNVQYSKSQRIEETISELSNTETVLVASPSLDPVHSNFVPESVKGPETNAGQSGTPVSSVGVDKELQNEVSAERSNGKSRILPFCSGDNLEESSNTSMNGITAKHREQIKEQINVLTENEKNPITIGSPKNLETGTDEGDTKVENGILVLHADLDISSSESETTDPLKEKKSNFSNKEFSHQPSFCLEETPSTDITENVDVQDTNNHHGCSTVARVGTKKDLVSQFGGVNDTIKPSTKIGKIFAIGKKASPFTKIDIPSERHEEPSSQLICTTAEGVEKPATKILQQYTEPGAGESNAKNGRCSISAFDVDIDISSSEPELDESKLIEDTKSKLANAEDSIQVPFSIDEKSSSTVPEKVIIRKPEILLDCGAVSIIGVDQEHRTELPLTEDNCEISKVNEEVFGTMITEKAAVVFADVSLREKTANDELDNEAQATPNVINDKNLQVFHAIPAKQITVSSSPMLPGETLSNNHLLLSEENREVVPPPQLDKTKPTGIHSPCRVSVADMRDGSPAKKDAHLSLVHCQDSVQEPHVFPRRSSDVSESATVTQNSQILKAVRTSSFEVPLITDIPIKAPNVFPTNATENSPQSIGSTQAAKKLPSEVPSEETNEESRILPFCSGDNLEESPNARINFITANHKGQIEEQINGLAENNKDPVPIGCQRNPASGTDEPDTNVQYSIFELHEDLDISSSKSGSEATNLPEENKSNFSNKEFTRQRPFRLEETPSTDIAESVDIQDTDNHHSCSTVAIVEAKKDLTNQLGREEEMTEPFAKTGKILEESPGMKIDIPSERHEEPSSQLICTTTEGVDKPVTKILQQYTEPGAGESDVNNGRCSISAFDVDIDNSSSESELNETNLIEDTKSKLANAEDSIQVPFSIDEKPSTTVPEKVIIRKSRILLDCAAISIAGIDQEHRTELPLTEDNCEISKVNEEVFGTMITEKADVADESLRKKTTDVFDNEAQATPDVINDKELSVSHAIPAKQVTVSSSQLSSRMLPGEVLSSNHPLLPEENLEAVPSLQLDKIKPTGIHSNCRFPVAVVGNGNPTEKDAHLSPVHRQDSVQESPISPRISSKVPEYATVPQNPQILKAVRTSAFKVPRIPDTPIKAPDVFPTHVTENSPSRGSTQAVKRTAADDEVAVILKQIRTNVIDLPATVSPLPRSPEPQPAVKIEEPKSRFPILPRCAFNWTRKKLPLGDQLTERFGSYLHPGIKARVRFRRVSRRLLEIRSPDILSNCFQGVTNFAEAERRPQPIVKLVQLVGSTTDLVGYEDDATELTQNSVVSAQVPNASPEKRLSTSFSTKEVEKVTLPKSNPTTSVRKKRKAQELARRQKPTTPALFGSSSSESESESESESDVVPQPIEEQLVKSSTARNQNETERRIVPSKESKQTPSVVATSRAQAMAQLVEPIVPLGRGNRPGFLPIKPNEGQREGDSMFNQSRLSLGLGRGAKISQPTIAPCSDALLSATIKSKAVTRVVAPSKHIFKEPNAPSECVLTNTILTDNSPAQEITPTRKRVSHASKRGMESDPVIATISPSSKRGRIQHEGLPTVSSQTTQSTATETPFEEVSVEARTRQKIKSTLTIKPQEMVKLSFETRMPSGNEELQPKIIQPKDFRLIEETVIKGATSKIDTLSENGVPMEVNTGGTSQLFCPEREMTVTTPSIAEKSMLTDSAKNSHQLFENSGVMVVDGRPLSPDAEESPRSPDAVGSPRPTEVEERPRLPDTEESPQSPNVEESPHSPDVEESPHSPDVEESPHSPDVEESPHSPSIEVNKKTGNVEDSSESLEEQPLQSFDKNRSLGSTVEIPLASSAELEEHQSTAFELVFKELLQENPPVNQKAGKLKKDINLCVNRVFKNPNVTEESWNSLIERAMRSDSKSHPFILIRKLVATVIKDWDSPIDLSKTPPAPPMAAVHQRCVMILKELDEANSKLTVEPSENLHMYSNLFLSECSAVMFQQDSSLTLEEMCSLARAYTAICRSRSALTRARTFLFDCVYFLPPRSYALTYTVLSVWADVLRHISFPLGPSCIDQTIAYLLLHNCKVKAVPGIAGKVLQARSFLQNTYGYKNVTSRTVDDLTSYLMTRFKETNSADEASNLSWSFALLTRWEGIDFAIQVIEKQLWPFLQRWSSGEGTNSGAAAVIIAIGMLGKTVPSSKRAGVQRILDAMKLLLQSDDVIPAIHEAAIEAVVLLGEEEDPKSVIEVIKAWKLVNTNLSQHSRQLLKAFLKRHSNLCVT